MNPKLGVSRERPNSSEAFSLVEVVVAIGIVSFAVLVIIGALPVGLKSIRNAETMQATSNIANQLRGQLQLLSFNSLGNNTIEQLVATNIFYTTDGMPTDATNAFYRVSFATTNAVASVSLNTNNAQSVLVSLSYPPGVWNETNTFSLLVARQTDN